MKNNLRVLATLLFFSCNRPDAPDCFKQAGSFAVKQRKLNNAVRNVILKSPLEVYIRSSSVAEIKWEGPKNLLEKIDIREEGNEIIITNRNRCNFVRGYKHRIRIYVDVPDLQKAINLSTGTLTVEKGFHLDTLRLESESGDIHLHSDVLSLSTSSHGNGNIYFTGKTQKVHIFMFGTNFFYGENGIIEQYAYVEQKSVGDALLNMKDGALMNYVIDNSGNIYYSGNIAIQGLIRGKGGIYKR